MSSANFPLISTLFFIFAAAILGGVVAKRFKLPAVAGYIGFGFIFGNIFGQFTQASILASISDIGLILLLFVLGIEFSFHRLKSVFPVIGLAAVVQILIVFAIVLAIFIGFGFSFLPAMFFAAASALSSTALVVKVLTDKGELDSIPGEVATGWLVIQDLAVVPMLLVLPVVVSMMTRLDTSWVHLVSMLAISILKSVFALVCIFVLGRRIIPKFLSFVASVGNRELLVLSTAAVVLTASVFGEIFGLSMAVGAFIAGLLVAETSQNHAVFAEIRPLRDLFSTIFFVTIGFTLPFGLVIGSLAPLLSAAIVVMIIKLMVVGILMRFLGYHRKTAFIVALGLTQMSEFGFVLGKVGAKLGAISSDQSSFLTALTCMTLLFNVPLFAKSHELYYELMKHLKGKLPKLFSTNEETLVSQDGQFPISNHIVLCGYGRVGKYIGRALEMSEVPYLVVDYNHATISELKDKKVNAVYGDPADREVLDFAQVDLARAIIIAIPDLHTQERIIAHAHSLNRRIRIICRTHFEQDQQRLKGLGVHTIVQPEFEAAISIVAKILSDLGHSQEEIAGKVSRLKIEHGLG